jgi:hypothetical protein
MSRTLTRRIGFYPALLTFREFLSFAMEVSPAVGTSLWEWILDEER